ncbi:DUF2723 domain-containing protein [Pedobacter panaciterrae]|jgi:Tellurite resistance protein and related permeases|uniref:DUF2723 domain-containing protein n=1 Tax=Pedobacter panaciterrae TaxID=363849 RepID=UPI00155DA615|nr:DUF2723 domain-containing protein [Pedobacter panaciterrae]NQX52935.1 DUF2723 domain-containing protein [Pedobacter panaciterrae]
MNHYQKINNLVGFLLFLIAGVVYWLTMEPTVSFWDCGEFISAADKLQVGHQPGAPLFLMIGKLFSLLAAGDVTKIAYWMNFSSVIFSAATVMFLYWTITLIASKLYKQEKTTADVLTVVATGVVGALAFTFSDTFWFSAVEAEVYSLSILFTALVFWAILKWESKTDDRWLVLIAFVIGLSIGVHLLSLLAIPAVVLVYYFKKTTKPTTFGIIKAIGVAGLIWVIVQFVIIQYFVLLAARFDLFFVNTLGFGFGYGAITFILLLAASITYAIYYSIKHKKYNLNLSMICLTFVLFGFSSYFLIIIRADAKPSLNLSNPDNAFALYGYLGRTNYGQTPLLYGQTFDAKQIDGKETYTKYRKGKDKYEVSGRGIDVEYDKNLLFPRTYSDKPDHINFYKQWLNLADGETPSFAQNLKFFASYQVGFMYWRYFFWNFVGRQNDNQGQGGYSEGNWITGIKSLDAIRLGSQTNLPPSIVDNEGFNRFYGLPLILGIAGLFFLYRRNRNDTLVITTLFLFTGLAIIVYLNQDPRQVRERDYAYVGSFYAFAIFIGFGVFAIREWLSRFNAPKLSLIVASLVGLLAAPAIMGVQGWGDHNRSGKATALEWAKNYLNSCAPNAILFVTADNDTFPLWYAQEVEGIRTDIRVVNIQYLSDDAYINQMKLKLNKSAALPITMPTEKYVNGVRDYIRYYDYDLKDSVELKDLLAVLTSDNKEDKLPLSDGSYVNFLPSQNFKLTVDSDQLVKTHTISPKDKDKVTPLMEWKYNKDIMYKYDLALLDIIANNNWERPIYFESNVSEDTYAGLGKYLYLEGYALRLLPFKTDPKDTRDKMEKTNSDPMYDNLMHKFDFKSFKTAKYIDPESRRVAQSSWSVSNSLTTNLFMEGKTDKARNILVKSVKEIPLKNYSVDDTINRYQTIQNMYALNETKAANELTNETFEFLNKELTYIASLEPKRFNAYGRDIQVGMYVLSNLHRMAVGYKQTELSDKIAKKFEELQAKFS